MGVAVCPASQLATLRFDNDADLQLFYQHDDKTVRELSYSGAESRWTYTSLSVPALVGTGLACEKWLNDDKSLREIMFFYEDPTCEVRSHFYIAADDQWNFGKSATEDIPNSKALQHLTLPVSIGYLHVPNMPPLCGIATAAHRHLGYNADVSRVYMVEASGMIVERSWRSDTQEWSYAKLTESLLEGKIAITWFPLNGNPEIRLFYQGPDGGIRGFNFQNRVWHHDHSLPCGD